MAPCILDLDTGVSGQPHASAALPPGKELLVPIWRHKHNTPTYTHSS